MSSTQTENFAKVGKQITEAMVREGVPGVAIGIFQEGAVKAAGFGVTNVEHPLPVTEDTLFQVGSITKTVAATAIMRLVEAGKLDLDAPVRTYLPTFQVMDETASAQVTLRHLLTHRAGWQGDLFLDTGAGDDASAKYMAKMAELRQLAPLGTVWSYNNASFYLAGHILELVTGKSCQAALQALVLTPLGLKHAYFDAGDVITHRFAVGHSVENRVAQVARPWPLPRAAYAAGGLTTTVKELLRYAQFHMGDGKGADGFQVLQPTSLAQMQTPQAQIRSDQETIGLSWFISDKDGPRHLSHGGGTNGQSTLLLFVPERKFALAIFTNAGRGGVINRDVSRWVLKHYLGMEVKVPQPIDSTVEQLAPYVGHYENPYAGVELGLVGGRLIAQATFKGGFPSQDSPIPPPPMPMPLGRGEADRLIVLDGESKDDAIDVVRKPDRSIGWLRMWGRIFVRTEGD